MYSYAYINVYAFVCISKILKIKNMLWMQVLIKFTYFFLVEDNNINACVKCMGATIN